MQLIGTLEINKTSKNGKILIAIPFLNKVDFFISHNKEKKSDNSPDFLVWSNKIKFGGIWKRSYNKDGIDKNYFSGSIFAPSFGFEKDQLRIVIFENEKEKNTDLYIGSVFWSGDLKKEIDPNIEEVTIMENDDLIF